MLTVITCTAILTIHIQYTYLVKSLFAITNNHGALEV